LTENHLKLSKTPECKRKRILV